MPPRKPAEMTAEERAAKVAALKPAWAQEYILQLEKITRTLHAQLQAAQAQGAGDLNLAREISGARDRLAEQATSVWTPAGITPPDGDFAVVRVLDGAAMEPVADLDDRAEIRFADFYQAHYGGHEGTGGMRVLVIEGDDAIIIHPVSKTTVLISRGGYTRH